MICIRRRPCWNGAVCFSFWCSTQFISKKVIWLARENIFEETNRRPYALRNTNNLALSALFPLGDTGPASSKKSYTHSWKGTWILQIIPTYSKHSSILHGIFHICDLFEKETFLKKIPYWKRDLFQRGTFKKNLFEKGTFLKNEPFWKRDLFKKRTFLEKWDRFENRTFQFLKKEPFYEKDVFEKGTFLKKRPF